MGSDDRNIAHPAQAAPADIIIAGAGLAGLAMACAVGQAGIRVVLIEPTPPDQLINPVFDGRTTAVAASSQRMFAAIGVWDSLAADAQPINDIRVADKDSPLFVHYDRREVGADALGWIVENRHLRAAMLDQLKALESVTFLSGCRVTGFNRGGVRASVTIDSGAVIEASLIVGADGRNSPSRRDAGIGVTEWRYDQTGIVCTVAHEHDHRGIAHEHFLASGPFAILPMTGNRSSIVWAEKNDVARRILDLSDDGFMEELSLRFGDFLGALSLAGPRFSYPLGLMHAETYIAPRLALVAEAAHTIHPIAGQGINIGWRDVCALAEIVTDTVRLGLDPGSMMVLEKYERWRRLDNTAMLAATDGLNRLFSNDIAPVQIARNIGLGAVERLPALKRVFMRHAMGDLGDLPRLVKGEPV